MIKGRYKPRTKLGSALILAVVLTSLLAIIGVMFVMMARVDKMATSAISENKELNFAVEAVVAKISQELVLDVPGMPKGSEYYDYSGEKDKWLASLEPYEKTAGNYYWRQISDVTGFLNDKGFPTQNVNVKPVGLSTTVYVREYPEITLDGNGELKEQSADADGDGIADSKWIELDDITSDKGKPIYAAIRIVDDGGMINVNTARQFDPNSAIEKEIDGSSQTQIDLLALAKRSSTSNPLDKLDDARFGSEPHNLNDYIGDVVWQYNEPNGRYTPFDISDELELRNRFLLEIESIDTAIETFGWVDVFTGDNYLHTPVDGTSSNLKDWFGKAQYDLSEPNATENYSYRHIATTYNMDRIIDPNGKKMLNINDANVSSVYDAIIDANLNIANPKAVAAQIAVNLIDFRDNDSNVSTIKVDGIKYYGFERPCVYISELAYRFRRLVEPGPIPYTLRRSYAIELYKPYYPEDNYPEPNQWRLNIQGYGTFPVNWSGTKHFHVICLDDPCAPLSPSVNFDLSDKDPNFDPSVTPILIDYDTTVSSISLERLTDSGWISVDSIPVPLPSWLVTLDEGTRSFKRDITQHKCIRRLWDTSGTLMASPSLGQRNPYYISGSPNIIQAHPYLDPPIYGNQGFKNIGEIGMVFCKSAYSQGPHPIEPNDTETVARINLADPNYQNLFQYITVFDPTCDRIDNDGDGTGENDEIDANELKVPGRININTAPWYVIAQLPWMQYEDGTPFERAKAVSDYRDSTLHGFKNIGELMLVSEMRNLYSDNKDNLNKDTPKGPDLTEDTAQDDFEERDVIFARISNLITVRSDVFTAYILVRIGTDGPQKRVIAILDRSNVYPGDDKVRIIALHPVPDPR